MATPDSYGYCRTKEGNDASTDLMMKCMSDHSYEWFHQYAKTLFLVQAASLVFFMQAGFAMVCAGAVRKKNVQNTMLKNLLDACGAAVAYYFIGYAFAFGGDDPQSTTKTFVGLSNFLLVDDDTDYAVFLFQYGFAAATATIVAGTIAERCQMSAYLCYSFVLTGFVYPVVAHAVWSNNGFLSAFAVEPLWDVGMIDFAGSGVVHFTGGITSLVAAIILGPRRGRFHDETGRKLDRPAHFAGHSMALQMLGTLILWFGWYGFNPGSALLLNTPHVAEIAALAGVNSTLAAGTGGIVALFLNLIVLERYTGEPFFDLQYAMNGVLCGLVAITGSCGVVEPYAAIIIGAVSGVIYLVGSRALIRWRIDDAVDAIPVHLFNGIWGIVAVGLFASPKRLKQVFGEDYEHAGLFMSGRNGGGNIDITLLGAQCIGLLFIMMWVLVIMVPFFLWLDWQGWFRSDPLEEIVGLDTSYHGGLALKEHGDDEVNPKYISAFKKKKEDRNRRHASFNGVEPPLSSPDDGGMDEHGGDDDDNVEEELSSDFFPEQSKES